MEALDSLPMLVMKPSLGAPDTDYSELAGQTGKLLEEMENKDDSDDREQVSPTKTFRTGCVIDYSLITSSVLTLLSGVVITGAGFPEVGVPCIAGGGCGTANWVGRKGVDVFDTKRLLQKENRRLEQSLRKAKRLLEQSGEILKQFQQAADAIGRYTVEMKERDRRLADSLQGATDDLGSNTVDLKEAAEAFKKSGPEVAKLLATAVDLRKRLKNDFNVGLTLDSSSLNDELARIARVTAQLQQGEVQQKDLVVMKHESIVAMNVLLVAYAELAGRISKVMQGVGETSKSVLERIKRIKEANLQSEERARLYMEARDQFGKELKELQAVMEDKKAVKRLYNKLKKADELRKKAEHAPPLSQSMEMSALAPAKPSDEEN